MNSSKPPQVPRFAEKLLSFGLPARVREPILGDLAEEYLLDILPQQGIWKGHYWYYKQAIRSLCIYAWREEDGAMAFFWSIVSFVCVIVIVVGVDFSTFTTKLSALTWLLDLRSFGFVLIPALGFAWAATSKNTLLLSFKLVFSEPTDISQEQVQEACRFLRIFGNTCLVMGGIGALLGAMVVLQNLASLTTPSKLESISLAVIAFFYGICLKLLFYTAEHKLRHSEMDNDL